MRAPIVSPIHSNLEPDAERQVKEDHTCFSPILGRSSGDVSSYKFAHGKHQPYKTKIHPVSNLQFSAIHGSRVV
jgi:hypothetical protein